MQFSFKISQREFTKLNIRLSLRQPYALFILLLGLANLILGVAIVAKLMEPIGLDPVLHLVGGAFFVFVIPYTTRNNSIKLYLANEYFQHPIAYEIDEKKITMTTNEFSDTFQWSEITKVKRVAGWMILYKGRAAAQMMPFNDLKPNEQEYILKVAESYQLV